MLPVLSALLISRITLLLSCTKWSEIVFTLFFSHLSRYLPSTYKMRWFLQFFPSFFLFLTVFSFLLSTLCQNLCVVFIFLWFLSLSTKFIRSPSLVKKKYVSQFFLSFFIFHNISRFHIISKLISVFFTFVH